MDGGPAEYPASADQLCARLAASLMEGNWPSNFEGLNLDVFMCVIEVLGDDNVDDLSCVQFR